MRAIAVLIVSGGLFGLALSACEATGAPAAPTSGPALVNGSFEAGLEGWKTRGDGAGFITLYDPVCGQVSITTAGPPNNTGGKRGEVYQDFVVPTDALALRFVLHGGRSHVKILEGGIPYQEIHGAWDPNQCLVVRWDIEALRGHHVRLAIIDDETDGPDGYVTVTGFDVIRDRPSTLVNGDFFDGLHGWELDGEARLFQVFNDPMAVGDVPSLTSWLKNGTQRGDLAVGKIWQVFVVPEDAIALRFAVHGGQHAYVRLRRAGDVVCEAVGPNSNDVRVPISWNLVPFRGQRVELAIEDDSQAEWSYIGSSGFTLVTASNGP